MSFIKKWWVLVALGCIFATNLRAEERPPLHSLFTDNMLLQREKLCPVWGWVKPGEEVTVRFAGQTKSTRAANDGRWEIKLNPLTATDKGSELIVVTPSKKITRRNVIVGDVWICSGQSNMAMGIKGTNQWWNQLPRKKVNGIRIFWVLGPSSLQPRDNVEASQWFVADKSSLLTIKQKATTVSFSAIAWLFARRLHQETGVPIGVIESAVGNTNIEAWSPTASLSGLQRYGDNFTTLDAFAQLLTKWGADFDPAWSQSKAWLDPAFDDSAWKTVVVPEKIPPTDTFSGVVWYRRDFTVPADWVNAPVTLNLGKLRKFSTVWINGQCVGGDMRTNKRLDGSQLGHIFPVPAGLVKPGANQITVRLVGSDGFAAPAWKDGKLFIENTATGSAVSLAGNWKRQRSTPYEQIKGRPTGISVTAAPGGLYNGMIKSLTPFAIKGFLWYQGEANAGQSTYYYLLTELIKDWRTIFNASQAPFYIAQLAGFYAYPAKPVEHSWAMMREIQTAVARDTPHCEIAVSADRGEEVDIHPPHKKDLADRLALLALQYDYGKDVVAHGPRYKSMRVEDDKIIVEFDHAAGLKSIGSQPAAFTIAGADGKFHWAYAKVDGTTTVVWHPAVKSPTAVRWGWARNAFFNLYNAANLPAEPFRSDKPDNKQYKK